MASLGIEMDVSMQLPQSFTPAEPIFPMGVGRRVMHPHLQLCPLC
jgi:hypothetical protein